MTGFGLAVALLMGQARTPDIFFSPTRHNIADAMLLPVPFIGLLIALLLIHAL